MALQVDPGARNRSDQRGFQHNLGDLGLGCSKPQAGTSLEASEAAVRQVQSDRLCYLFEVADWLGQSISDETHYFGPSFTESDLYKLLSSPPIAMI